MSELTDFLLARIGEDEAIARHATRGPWTSDYSVIVKPGPAFSMILGEMDTEMARAPEDATHIARHDPTRVLSECEAKRRLVRNAQTYLPGEPGYGAATFSIACLALPYADHPDYRDEWKP